MGMRANGKLEKILKLRQMKEQETAGALVRTRMAREQAQAKAEELQQITDEYRDAHEQQRVLNPFMLRQFREFYGQLNKAAKAQNNEIELALQAEAVVMNHFRGHYADRRALEELLKKRELAHKNDEKRAERKNQLQAGSGQRHLLV